MNEVGLQRLREGIVSGLDELAVSEAEKLRQAVEGKEKNSYVGGFITSDIRCVEALVNAELLELVFTFDSSGKTEYLYQAKPLGLEVYNLIFGGGNKD